MMQGIVSEPTDPNPEYDEDKIFLGWKLGDKDLYQDLEDAIYFDEGQMSSKVVKDALRLFQRKAGQRQYMNGKPEKLYLDQSSAAVTFSAGERGAGKSFKMRGESNRSAEAGVLNVIVDPSHEYYTNNFKSAVQEKFKNLDDTESKHPVPTTVLMPYYVNQGRKRDDLTLPGEQWTQIFKFTFSDLDPAMVSYLFLKDVKPSDRARYEDFEKYTRELNQAIQDGGIEDFGDCKDLANRLKNRGEIWNQGPRNNRANEIIDKLERYQEWGFLCGDDSRYSLDLEEVLAETNTIALSLDDNDNLPRQLEMNQLYIALLIKKLRTLTKKGELDRKVQFMVDEVHKFVDSEDYGREDRQQAPPAHWQLRQVIKEDRDKGFRVSMASQEVTDIPEDNFLKQSDHVFIPMNIDAESRDYLLDLYDVHEGGKDRGNRKWQKIFRTMNEYNWFYIRKKTRYWCLLEVASPLAYHKTEDS
jgi:hypothetical protein